MGTGGDIAIGSRAGEALITGGQNIFIGQDAGQGAGQSDDVQNCIAIGAGTLTVRSNQTVLGNDTTEETIIRGNIVKNNVVTVSQLPSATDAGSGARAFVSDATSTTFNDALVGGGAAAVPVFSDGATWRIG